ncbi:C-C motif chemokine 19-like [Narcine bancroftii]|uniref:C-C motif chemokine 19-like n=1 Tax=Narcine bancroftii TaxID=1343680 RepID=UPI003831AF58
MTLRIQCACLLAAVLFLLGEGRRGDSTADCCLSVGHKKIPRYIVVGYKEQNESSGCRIQALVFTTVKGRNLCAPHNARWAIRLMRWCDHIFSSSRQ